MGSQTQVKLGFKNPVSDLRIRQHTNQIKYYDRTHAFFLATIPLHLQRTGY